MVIVLYNDNALDLEKKVMGVIREKAVFLEAGPENTHPHSYSYISRFGHSYNEVYNLFLYHHTSIKLYRKTNSLGWITLKIEISGFEEGAFRDILKQSFIELKEKKLNQK